MNFDAKILKKNGKTAIWGLIFAKSDNFAAVFLFFSKKIK